MAVGTAYFGIGGLRISFTLPQGHRGRRILGNYLAFAQGKPRAPDLAIISRCVEPPNLKAKGSVFNTESSWSLAHLKTGYLYQDSLENAPYLRKAVVDKDFSRTTVYLGRQVPKDAGLLNWILDVPLGQFLFTSILAQKEGLLLHACAVVYQDEGFIFMGPSGSGKSTLAQLWRKIKGAVVLSDERIVLRRQGNRFSIYGTPWTGSGLAYADRQAPLKCLYLIRHARHNMIRPLQPGVALPVFLSNIRLPLWDKTMTRKTLSTAGATLSSVPIFSLGFVPRMEAIEHILRHAKCR